jgi:pimeloyl-ACP methyl ester carboxylesterase
MCSLGISLAGRRCANRTFGLLLAASDGEITGGGSMLDNTEPVTGYATVKGARIYYRMAGKGKTIVLMHAGIADSRMWEPQFDLFARHFQVIAYDLRGYGRTEMPPGSYAHHRDLYGLLNYLGIPRASLVGVSMSGGKAINFAIDYPGMVEKLVLVASGVEGYEFKDQATVEQWPAIENAIERGDYLSAANLEIKMWVAGPRRTIDQVDPGVVRLVKDMLLPTYATPPERGIEERLEPAATNRLWEIRSPTLVVVGDQDVPDILSVSKIVIAAIQGAQRVTIAGAAHLPNLEKPDEFNRVVLDFLGART